MEKTIGRKRKRVVRGTTTPELPRTMAKPTPRARTGIRRGAIGVGLPGVRDRRYRVGAHNRWFSGRVVVDNLYVVWAPT